MTLTATIAHVLTDPLQSPVVVRAGVELVLLGVVAAGLGCWVVLADLSYNAESLAHGMFPGLVLAALLGVPLLVGGALGVLIASLLIAAVARVDGLEPGVAVATVVTALLGGGVLLGLSPRTPAGLGAILFGDALGVSTPDIALAAGLAVVALGALVIAHPLLVATQFDRPGRRASGAGVAGPDALLAVLLALTTLVAVQALGNLLVVALLVGPAATARLLTRRLGTMFLSAAAIAVAGPLAGLYLSYHGGIAAGASVAAVLAVTYLAALAGRGSLDRVRHTRAGAHR